MAEINFFVDGVPAPKGSFKNYGKSNNYKITNSNKNTKPWQNKISVIAKKHALLNNFFIEGETAIGIKLIFFMPRPKTVKRELPCVKPDIDKLERCVLDGLEGVLFENDSRIVQSEKYKLYEVNGRPGVAISLWSIDQEIELVDLLDTYFDLD